MAKVPDRFLNSQFSQGIKRIASKGAFFARNMRYLYGNETFRNHHSPMALVDSSGKIIRINNELSQLPHFKDAKKASPIFDFILEEHRADVLKAMKRALKTNEIQEVAFRHSHSSKDGKPIIVDFIIHPKNGRLVEISWRNITSAAEKLMKTEGTNAKNQRRIELGEMTARVSHDMGTPVATMLAAQELMLRALKKSTPDTVTLTKHTETMGRAVKQLQDLLELLRLHRISPDQIKRQDIHPNDLLNMTRMVTRHFAGDNEIKFIYPKETHVQQNREDPMVHVNLVELNSTLSNFLKNASDAIRSSETGGTVILSFRRTKNKEGIIFSIKDDGPGIPEKVFNDLKQGKQISTKLDAGGSGIGINSARRIIESHGGRMKIKTSTIKGKSGTEISFTLPIAPPQKIRKE
ncbi:MAG: PAS domain-containing sensor histidine kinase [archaeon]|nr:PAS domain-containing sensor histidine kinase [archaeon]